MFARILSRLVHATSSVTTEFNSKSSHALTVHLPKLADRNSFLTVAKFPAVDNASQLGVVHAVVPRRKGEDVRR